jgi:hypothetical protein
LIDVGGFDCHQLKRSWSESDKDVEALVDGAASMEAQRIQNR